MNVFHGSFCRLLGASFLKSAELGFSKLSGCDHQSIFYIFFYLCHCLVRFHYSIVLSLNPEMQKVFVCPEVRVPKLDRSDRNFKRKEPSEDFRQNNVSNKRPKSEKEELRSLMKTVKEYSSQSLVGLSKKAHKDQKLTKLGAAPPKQQTMPFKMKMGILAGKKKRKQREAREATEAQVIHGGTKIKSSKGKKRH